MPRNKVRLDSAGIAAILKSEPGVVSAIHSLAESVAANVRGNASVQRHAMPVAVQHMTTDRTKSIVVIAHPGGLGVQAKHGALTQAASAAGLEVKSQ